MTHPHDYDNNPLYQPKKHIALYGPPGAGKSTIISLAKTIGWNGLDLEDVGSTFEERRTVIGKLADGKHPWTIFGAADIPPELFPDGTAFVLLAPSEDILVARVKERNDTRAHKWIEHAKKVRSEHLQMAHGGIFHLTITDTLTPEETLKKIADGLL